MSAASWEDEAGNVRLKGTLHGGGGLSSVTDGVTTVAPAVSLDFTSGATVTDGGAGVAQVAVAGGSSPVTCNLLAPGLDASTIAIHALLWSALQDDPWGENPLLAIPAGLGMTFAFDGTDSTLTTTEAGTWALSLALFAQSQDLAWDGRYDDGLWGQSRIVGTSYLGNLSQSPLLVSAVMTLPAGAQLQPSIVTATAAASSQVFDASLIVTRLG